jgi:hypothetical protein
MSDETPGADNDWTITLRSVDGTPHRCRILDIFRFEERQYALLLRLDVPTAAPADATTEPPLVIMRLIERDDQSVFQTIDSDDEFDRVSAYVRSRAES